MKTRWKIVFSGVLFLLLALTFPVRAEVYTLWPFRSVSGNDVSAESLLQPKQFWSEKIIVNGTELTLNIFLMDATLDTINAAYRSEKVPDRNFFRNGNSLLVQDLQKNGDILRTYFLSLSGVRSTLCFKMLIPPARRKMERSDWPAGLPFVADAQNVTCMRFPVRNAVYGSFQLSGATVPQAVSDLSSRLVAMGWNPVSREADHVFEGTGEVFLKQDPLSIMILGVAESSDKKTVSVSMYSRPL